VREWLAEHAPATAARNTPATLRRWREQVGRERPELAHDLSAMRRESLRLALADAGDDPALAEPAFDLFFELRQQVRPFDEVADALARLAGRYRLVALSNGNADVSRVPGVGEHFSAALSARSLGVSKPAAQAFHAACAAVDCAPGQVLHVGDHGEHDIDGARDAGLGTVWVTRPGMPESAAPRRAPDHRVADLAELAARLGV
jgi:putative hydrolase of the HAD superfamily